MRPLRYSVKVTLDGCGDHRAIPADKDLHRHGVENINRADALLFGRVTYKMMESAWRRAVPGRAGPEWMEPLAQTLNAAKTYVVWNTVKQVDWTAELVPRDLGTAVQQLKCESGHGLFGGGVTLPLTLIESGLIGEHEPLGASSARGPWATTVRGAIEARRLGARQPAGVRLGGSSDAIRAEKGEPPRDVPIDPKGCRAI